MAYPASFFTSASWHFIPNGACVASFDTALNYYLQDSLLALSFHQGNISYPGAILYPGIERKLSLKVSIKESTPAGITFKAKVAPNIIASYLYQANGGEIKDEDYGNPVTIK